MRKTNYLCYKEVIICALVAVGIGILAYFSATMFASWENIILDWHLRQTFSKANQEKIVLILGGDKSMAELDSWPWPRETHGRLISEQLKEAKVIAYDVFLVDKTTKDQDDLLAQAISDHGNVVLGNAYRSDGVLLQPLEQFKENALTGYFNFYPDNDFIVRRYKLAKRIDYGSYMEIAPSFVFAVLEAAGFEPLIDSSNRLQLLSVGQEIKLDKNLNVFKLPVVGESYSVYEFSAVLKGKVPPEAFKDAIVFVGISATGASDIVHTSTGYITGTRALTDVFYSLLSGGMPYEAEPFYQILFAAVIAFVCLIGALYLPSRLNWLSLVLSIPITVAASRLIFRFAGVYLQAIPLCVILMITGVFQLIYLRVAQETRQRQEMNMHFAFIRVIQKYTAVYGVVKQFHRLVVGCDENINLGEHIIRNIRHFRRNIMAQHGIVDNCLEGGTNLRKQKHNAADERHHPLAGRQRIHGASANISHNGDEGEEKQHMMLTDTFDGVKGVVHSVSFRKNLVWLPDTAAHNTHRSHNNSQKD